MDKILLTTEYARDITVQKKAQICVYLNTKFRQSLPTPLSKTVHSFVTFFCVPTATFLPFQLSFKKQFDYFQVIYKLQFYYFFNSVLIIFIEVVHSFHTDQHLKASQSRYNFNSLNLLIILTSSLVSSLFLLINLLFFNLLPVLRRHITVIMTKRGPQTQPNNCFYLSPSSTLLVGQKQITIKPWECTLIKFLKRKKRQFIVHLKFVVSPPFLPLFTQV